MKTFLRLVPALLLVTAFCACDKPQATDSTPAETSQADGDANDAVRFKEGHGLALHPKIRQSIGLVIAEVSETSVTPEFTVQLHVIQGVSGLQRVTFLPGNESRSEASGWLSKEKAGRLQPGQEAELHMETEGLKVIEKGVLKRIEKPISEALGDYEVIVETEKAVQSGTRLSAVFRLPPGDAVTAVPRSALLKTVEGWFVYAINEDFFLRTPVKVGAMNNELVEITDGLYAGDQIVVSPVNSLWMAELQILRGGKACTCGH